MNITLIKPDGTKIDFEKSHAERILCLQIRNKIPENKSFALLKTYKFVIDKSNSDCNCGVTINKVTISKTKVNKTK